MIYLKTYQDLQNLKETNLTINNLMNFVKEVMEQHKDTEIYKTAVIAYEYFKHRNITIVQFQKLLYTVTGNAIPDNWSANYKLACRHFYRFITQENQFLLGNGVNWQDSNTADKLGTKAKPFDNQLQDVAVNALIGAVAYGFYNYDHIDVFKITEFAPLYDEFNGALKAGVRFWQIAENKPLRATLYELDGYTEFAWIGEEKITMSDEWRKAENGCYYKNKKPYKLKVKKTIADGEQIVDGENYPEFPIVPLWANKEKQSEIVGLREQIDCYDLIKSGLANNVDDASLIYWTITNADAMTDKDLARFKERIKTIQAVTLGDEVDVQSHQIDVPYQSREVLLDRIDKDLYRDAMALDVDRIANGAVTATQIEAAYEPLNSKCDMFEYCVLDFIYKIMELAEIEDEPTFTRSMIVNVSEQIQNIVQASPNLPEEYVTEKILTILGDKDRAEEIIAKMQADSLPIVE